jgi:hypothetical protein
MPQFVLTQHYTRRGITLAQGTILSTDAPISGIFYVAPDEADRLLSEGLLQEYTPQALTGARSREPGWRPIARRAPVDPAGQG